MLYPDRMHWPYYIILIELYHIYVFGAELLKQINGKCTIGKLKSSHLYISSAMYET
jgi:hypothetical protein